jgi:hypothetical protein
LQSLYGIKIVGKQFPFNNWPYPKQGYHSWWLLLVEVCKVCSYT